MSAEMISAPVGPKPDVDLAWVPCWQMTPDHPFQRSQDPDRIEKMTSRWRDDLIGAVVLVANPNYKPKQGGAETQYWIIEGGHRHKTAMGKFGGGYLLPAVIVRLKTSEEIARNFLDINGERRGIAKRDQYSVGTSAEMEPYKSINVILTKHDLAAGHTQRDHNIGALGTLVTIYNQWGGGILNQTIVTLIDAFGYMQTTWSAPIMSGVAEIYGINGSKVDSERLVAVLSAKEGQRQLDPKRWEMKGVALRQSAGGSTSRGAAVCEAICEKYNKGIRTRSDRLTFTRPRPLVGVAAARAEARILREAGTVDA